MNLYDFEWRHFDPFLARTTTQDPHANRYSHFSPYSWAANNPISVIDPDGRDIIYGADRITFTGADAQAAFAALKNSSNSNGNGPCKGPDCDEKKNGSKEALVGTPLLAGKQVGKQVAKKTVTSGGGWLGLLGKTFGLTIGFLLDGPEAGRGSAMTNRLTKEQEERYHDLQNKRMAEGLDQAEELEYQELVEEKFPYGSPYEQSFEKMRQGNNQKKNQEVESLYKEYGITDMDDRQKIHRLITGKGYSRDEIKAIIEDYRNNKGK